MVALKQHAAMHDDRHRHHRLQHAPRRTTARRRAARSPRWRPRRTRSPPCRGRGRRRGRCRRGTTGRAAPRPRCRRPWRCAACRAWRARTPPAWRGSSRRCRRPAAARPAAARGAPNGLPCANTASSAPAASRSDAAATASMSATIARSPAGLRQGHFTAILLANCAPKVFSGICSLGPNLRQPLRHLLGHFLRLADGDLAAGGRAGKRHGVLLAQAGSRRNRPDRTLRTRGSAPSPAS